ncbi:marR family protein [Mycobacterium kansasii]|uniref:MarR family protein n=1 Tax=Mycobacterium kansasii TaxID=1768 RepID=A0A1V3X6N7_MYCKA|nr:marR family protein [Mycobacterium kansasii]
MMTAHSDRVGRYYARQNDLSHGDFHALLHLMVAETAGTPLTPAQLSQRLDVSAAAITYLADRMIDAGHVRREPDVEDRRRSLLRLQDGSMELAHEFFRPLGEHLRASLAELPDRDLRSAHKVFTAMIAGMSAFESELYPPPGSAARTEESAKAAPGRRRKPSPKPATAEPGRLPGRDHADGAQRIEIRCATAVQADAKLLDEPLQPIFDGVRGLNRGASSGRASATTSAPRAIALAASIPVRIPPEPTSGIVGSAWRTSTIAWAVGMPQSAKSG